MNHSSERRRATPDTIEARFGARLAAGLNERAAGLPHDISERLRTSRERALTVSRQVRAAQASRRHLVVGMSSRGAAYLGQGHLVWLQLASWLPLALLVAGLVLIQQWSDREQVLAAAEIDAVLLADDLPPAAWSDPGFREYLRSPPP
jgi:hypothetical protein